MICHTVYEAERCRLKRGAQLHTQHRRATTHAHVFSGRRRRDIGATYNIGGGGQDIGPGVGPISRPRATTSRRLRTISEARPPMSGLGPMSKRVPLHRGYARYPRLDRRCRGWARCRSSSPDVEATRDITGGASDIGASSDIEGGGTMLRQPAISRGGARYHSYPRCRAPGPRCRTYPRHRAPPPTSGRTRVVMFWCMSMPTCVHALCSVRPAAPGGSGESGGWERVPPERWGRTPCAYMVMV